MFPKLLAAYKEEGYDLHIGNNNCLCSCLVKDGHFNHTGGGIGITDIAFFVGLSKVFTPKRILCIGNAAGYGTFCLAEIFACPIDVLDAEIEGDKNKTGSELTRIISQKHYNGRINLQIGFSPYALTIFGHKDYDLIFLDGKHTNEQQIMDYHGMVKIAAPSCIFYLHDVELLQMQDSYQIIKENKHGFTAHDIDFSSFGCKALVRELPEVDKWLNFLHQSPLAEHQHPVATIRAKEVVQPKQEEQ